MVADIINDNKIILEQLGKIIERATKAKDECTVDMIGAYIRELEKSIWLLNALSKSTKKELNTDFVK